MSDRVTLERQAALKILEAADLLFNIRGRRRMARQLREIGNRINPPAEPEQTHSAEIITFPKCKSSASSQT